MINRQKIYARIAEIILILISLIVLIPLIIVLLNSLKNPAEAELFKLSLPSRIVWDNYHKVFSAVNIGLAVYNGALYSIVTAFFTVILSGMCSFVLIRNRCKLYTGLYYIFISGLIIPMSIIPTIWVMQKFKIYGSYSSLILLYIAVMIPFTVFVYTGFMKTISKEIDESAIIDGSGAYSLFFRIIFPLLKPVTITAVLIVVIGIWNDFMFQLYFTKSTKMWGMPITVYRFFGQYSRQWNLVCADIVLTSTPIIVIFALFQKYIVSGMTAGAVKG